MHYDPRSRITLPVAAALLAAGLGQSVAADPSIGAFFDTNATLIEQAQPNLTQGTLYLIALPSSPLDGTTGAEFRLDNFPADWVANAVPNPFASIALGNPIAGGCVIAFPSCQGGPPNSGAPVLLYTVNYFALSFADHHVMTIQQHTTPSNPNHQCPSLINCGPPPIFSQFCVAGGSAAFNYPGYGQPAVEARSWARVKALYD